MTLTKKYVPGFSPEEIREQLGGGYANLEFGLGSQDRDQLFRGFQDVVALTQERGGEAIAEALTFSRNNYGNSQYELSLRVPDEQNPEDQDATIRDHKYVFHYGSVSRERAEAALGVLPAELGVFLDNCEEFYQEGVRVAQIGATALGIKPLLFHEANQRKDVHHLRLLDYISREKSTHAEPHFDRGVVTLAIGESHPGLRGRPSSNGFPVPLTEAEREALRHLAPIAHREGVAKFFASAGLRRLPLDVREENGLDDIPLLAHDVVNEEPGVDRQAVVMFFNPHLDTNYHPLPNTIPVAVRRSDRFYFVPTAAETKILVD